MSGVLCVGEVVGLEGSVGLTAAGLDAVVGGVQGQFQLLFRV